MKSRCFLLFIIIFSFCTVFHIMADDLFYCEINNKEQLFSKFNEQWDILKKKNYNFKELIIGKQSNLPQLSVIINYDSKDRRFFLDSGENIFHRLEILFFGSLTVVSFCGWLLLSLFNVIIYEETFSYIRRDQYLLLYVGASVVSFGVCITDLLMHIKPRLKNKTIDFYTGTPYEYRYR